MAYCFLRLKCSTACVYRSEQAIFLTYISGCSLNTCFDLSRSLILNVCSFRVNIHVLILSWSVPAHLSLQLPTLSQHLSWPQPASSLSIQGTNPLQEQASGRWSPQLLYPPQHPQLLSCPPHRWRPKNVRHCKASDIQKTKCAKCVHLVELLQLRLTKSWISSPPQPCSPLMAPRWSMWLCTAVPAARCAPPVPTSRQRWPAPCWLCSRPRRRQQHSSNQLSNRAWAMQSQPIRSHRLWWLRQHRARRWNGLQHPPPLLCLGLVRTEVKLFMWNSKSKL